MSQFATGVTVVTTRDEDDEPHSMTANSFTSVCLDPPTVLICVAHGTNTYGFLEKNQKFGINILSEKQEQLGQYFARRPENRDGELPYSYSDSADGIPILDNSMVFFGCQVVGSHVYGDHTVYFGEVSEVVLQKEPQDPLLFFRSRWYHPGRD